MMISGSGGGGGGGRRSSGYIRCCLVVFAIVSALCICGPALYWKINKGVRMGHVGGSVSNCPPCVCDCAPPISLLNIAPGLVNLSIQDCGKSDPDLHQEMRKQTVDLLTEELQLQETVSKDHLEHMNATNLDAWRLASHYQREAEKCNAAIEACEEARERAEALLRNEMRASLLWEQRARQFGWQGE
ncbi:hypothetical protein Droror1_Dr00013601 [Drosera rotundifolia]